MVTVRALYLTLVKNYGPQGWWPLVELHGSGGSNPTKTGSVQGYHPDDYSYPKTRAQQLEICFGAILTQNTNWVNAERAVQELSCRGAIDPDRISALPTTELAQLIRSAGYYNQKAQKLKSFAAFLEHCPLEKLERMHLTEARSLLLGVKGIGPETADSILLYACKQPVFVIDAYTRRIAAACKLAPWDASYEELQHLFMANLSSDYRMFNEYHALLVEHGKRHYQRKPYGSTDPFIKTKSFK